MNLKDLVQKTKIDEVYGVEPEEVENGRIIDHFSEVIMNILTFSLQIHIYHLQTISGNDHLVLGEFYETLRNEGDELAEKFIGLGDTLDYYEEFDCDFTMTYDKAEMLVEIMEFKEDIIYAIKFTDNSDYMSMQEDLVEIVGAIDTVIYKLRMV